MSSAPTQLVVAPTASNIVTTTTSQIQKDYLEEPLARQNSLGNRVRGSLKGKHLTRSHAMRESASPPRTPTPRSDQQLATSPVPNCSSYSSSSSTASDPINDSNNKMHVQSSSLSASPTSLEAPSVIVTSQHSQQQQQNYHNHQINHCTSSSSENNINFGVVCDQNQLDVDFPKLTPPKSSKSPRNNNNSNINNNNRDQSQSSVSTTDRQQNNEYNNKVAFSSTGNMTSNNSASAASALIESITMSSTHNKNGSMKMNGQNNNNSNNNMHHQNWNRHNSPSAEQHINTNNGGGNMNNNLNTNSPPLTNINSNGYNNNIDKENRCPRIESQNSNNSGTYSLDDNQSESPTDGLKGGSGSGSSGGGGDRINKKHKNGANSKSSKPRLKNMGSSSSVEGGNSTSGFISRDSSTEQFTDQSGVDLIQFFRDTLNKSPKDKNMLMKIEKDLTDLANDGKISEMKFPAMSSYNRMLIHRVAAFFGMEHNVDATAQCVIVQTTKATRIPDIRFKSLVRDRLSDEPRKSILKRDTHSFEDPRHSFLMCPDRGILDRKAKSFEEREEEYEKVRRRIFRRDGSEIINPGDETYWSWQQNSDNSDQPSNRMRHQQPHHQQHNKLLKVHSLSNDPRQDGRPNVSKSHSFSGYGGPPNNNGNNNCGGGGGGGGGGSSSLPRGDSINSTKSAGPRLFSKQDSVGSTNTPWRLSPSSSGYKTQTQSLRSDSVTPSPTGGCGSDENTPEPSIVYDSPPTSASCGVVWAVTDMASVPRGSVLINPQTLQPIVNQDGSIYHFDPSNLPPPSQAMSSSMYSNAKNIGINTSMHRRKNDKIRRGEMHGNSSGGGGNLYNGSNGNSGNNSNNSNVNCGIMESCSDVNCTVANCTGPSVTTSNLRNGSEGNQVIAESSIENISSESSSAQTVVVLNSSCNRDDCNMMASETIEEDDTQDGIIITKENHCRRDMSDIQEETINHASLDDIQNVATNCDELNDTLQQKPKLKNQATSPNIPSPEPSEDIETQLNEVTITSNPKDNNSFIDRKSNNSSTAAIIANSTSSSPKIHDGGNINNSIAQLHKKDDSFKNTSLSTNTSVITYTNSYPGNDGSAIFPASSGATYPATTYQQAPDGSIYAISQPMIYAYPPPMEGEIQGYFMPVFDQSSQRDPNGALLPATPTATATAPAIYQPPGGTTTVVPLAAYPTAAAPYPATPIYQGQVVYTPAEQFATTNSAAASQVQQYPITYPVSYPYPYNGYWGPTMTYYVPQPLPGNATVSSAVMPPPPIPTTPGNSHVTNISSGTGGSSGGKRNSSTPQQQQQQQQLTNGSQNSQSVASANTYQFAAGVPLALATSDPNGPTMYAIPQSAAVFPNMLPYGPPSTPSAAATSASLIAPLPHQHNAVISSLVSHPSGLNGPHIPLEPPPACATYALPMNTTNGNHGTNGGTPQSTPSTPLSTNMPANMIFSQPSRNPPLFPTPPMMQNGINSTQIHNQFATSTSIDSHNTGSNSSTTSYERKSLITSGSVGSNMIKKSNNTYISNNNSSNTSSHNSSNSRHSNSNSYSHNPQNSRKIQNDNSNNGGSNQQQQQNMTSSINRSLHHGGTMQQKQRSNDKTQQIVTQNNTNTMGNNVGNNVPNSNSDKPRSIRSKPANLDFRRNNISQRNSPSTNSMESNNNSPNSIAGVSSNSGGGGNSGSYGINGGNNHGDHIQYMSGTTRGAHIPSMHPQTATAAIVAATAAVTNDPTACHQSLIGAYNHPPPAGMYIKYGQTYFAHPSMALPSSRRSPPNDLRPQIPPLTGVYSTVNMMLPAPRQMQPRHPNPNYKSNKSGR